MTDPTIGRLRKQVDQQTLDALVPPWWYETYLLVEKASHATLRRAADRLASHQEVISARLATKEKP